MDSENPPNHEPRAEPNLRRRRYLQLATATAGSIFGLSGTATAATVRRGISFDRTVNIAEEYDVDTTGNRSINGAVRDAAADGNLIVFPEGTYKFSGEIELTGYSTIGILGKGDVNFVPASGFNGRIFNIGWNTENVLIEGVTVDISASDTTAGFRTEVSNRAVLQSITFEGRGTHPDTNVVNAFSVESTDSNATTILRDIDIPKGSSIDRFGGGKGRSAVWAGPGMKGTLKIQNSRFAEFGNNAVYASKTAGDVQVVSCSFANNNVSSVRISGSGSYVKNSNITLDVSELNASTEGWDYNMRGVWIEQGPHDFASGALVENCNIRVLETGGSQGGIVVAGSGKELEIKDTNIYVKEDGTVAINRRNPDTSPNRLVADGVSITGPAAGNSGIIIEGTTDSVIKNSCISQPGRDGIYFDAANDASVNRSIIDVGGTQVIRDKASVSTWELDNSGSCPLPPNVSSSSNYDTVEVKGIGGHTEYRLDVNQEINARDGIEDNDWAGDTTAKGAVVDGGADRYEYKWDLTNVSVTSGSRHDIRVFVNGNEKFLNRLTVSADKRTEYKIEVTGDVTKWSKANATDEADNGVATGVVEGGTDTFGFSGDVADLTVTDGSRSDLQVEVNGEPYVERTLEIESKGDHVSYRAKVTGDIFDGERSNEGDVTGDGYAEGDVWNGGVDSYQFYGWLSTVDAIEGERSDLRVYVDGERPWKELEISAADWVEYRVEVTGKIEAKNSIEGDDQASGTVATGGVASGGVDRYHFTGDLDNVSTTTGSKSDLTLSVNGTERNI